MGDRIYTGGIIISDGCTCPPDCGCIDLILYSGRANSRFNPEVMFWKLWYTSWCKGMQSCAEAGWDVPEEWRKLGHDIEEGT